METKFFLCKICGNVVVKVADSGRNLSCCGVEMKELVPNGLEGSGEKHMPMILCMDDGTVMVKVGCIAHPMTKEHRIMFIYIETEDGGQIRYLEADKPAEAFFHVCREKIVAVYAYCNIHGLWKKTLKCERK